MKISTNCLCTIFLILSPTVLTIAIWQENLNRREGERNVNFSPKSETREGECFNSDEDERDYSTDDYFLRNILLKKNIINKKIANQMLTTEGKRNPSKIFYYSGHQIPCTCGIHFKLTDLGSSYLPRYIRTGTCKINGCPHRCTEKYYEVRVLKNLSGTDTSESPREFLENLPANMDLVKINVTVACECAA